MAKRASYQTRYHNKLGTYVVLGVFVVFAVILFINCYALNQKKERLQAEYTEYQEMYEKEMQETLDLQELEKETKTMKYYEQVAKERLGMVYEDEIIFKEGN